MSLKQECIDMIKLITEPLKKDDYNLYEIEIDSTRDICESTGEDVTYSDCYGCENYGKNCLYKKHVKVDVSFCDYGDFEKNYVFSKKNLENKGICYIRNRKQLMDEMLKLKKEVEQYKDWYADFGEKYSDYLEYAKEFGEKLKKEFCFFETVNTDILPIVFHTGFAKDDEGNTNYTKRGDLYICGNQNVINTYYCMDDVEETKRNIRHELIHYFLYMSDMKYKDDVAVFHYLCGLYDAHAYKEMGENEQALYNKLMDALPELENKCKELDTKEDTFDNNRMIMLFAIGSDRERLSDKELFDNGMNILNVMNEISKRKQLRENFSD